MFHAARACITGSWSAHSPRRKYPFVNVLILQVHDIPFLQAAAKILVALGPCTASRQVLAEILCISAFWSLKLLIQFSLFQYYWHLPPAYTRCFLQCNIPAGHLRNTAVLWTGRQLYCASPFFQPGCIIAGNTLNQVKREVPLKWTHRQTPGHQIPRHWFMYGACSSLIPL